MGRKERIMEEASGKKEQERNEEDASRERRKSLIS
jgi:hypothetical protein